MAHDSTNPPNHRDPPNHAAPRDLALHFAGIPPDTAQPGDGLRYLMEHARFLVDLPERLNFRTRVRQLLRHGHVGEALFVAMAYDEHTMRLVRAERREPPVEDAGDDRSADVSTTASDQSAPPDPLAPRSWGNDAADDGGEVGEVQG